MSDAPPCPLCAHKESGTVFSSQSFSVQRCPVCKLHWADAPSKDQVARYNDDYYGNYLENETLVREFFKQELLRVSPLVPGKRLLDVGFGAGFFLQEALPQGWNVEGIESSWDAVALTRKRLGDGGHRVTHGEFLKSNFSPADFDLICFWDVLAHIQTPRLYLEHALKLLKRGGLLVIKTPARPETFFQTIQHLPSWVRESLLHWPWQQYYFDRETFERMLPELGYSLVEARVVREIEGHRRRSLWAFVSHPKGALLAGLQRFYNRRYLSDSWIIYARRP